MIPNPWWLRFMDGGNAKTSAIAAVAFAIGYMWGKGDRNHWREVARHYDDHWRSHERKEPDHHGHHTDREYERRQHKHGDERGR
jgi:hypothetical protein